MLTVTTGKGWLAVAVMAAMAAAVLVWSVYGEISTFVRASGILLHRGGTVVDAVASGNGTLSRIIPSVGDAVEKGQVVVETVNEETMERYRNALDLATDRRREFEDRKAAWAEEDALIDENVARQRERLRQLEHSTREAASSARARLEDHVRLLEERVVTRMTVERSQQEVDRTRRELFSTLRERDDLEAREIKRRNDRLTLSADFLSRIRAAERRASELAALIGAQRVIAPVSGHVTEIKVATGTVLAAGQPVLSIRTGTEILEAQIYIPPGDGKKVTAGMEALVSPSTLRREKYGSVKGTMATVSSFPVSLEGMLAVLQNRDLARTFSQAGPPYAGRVIFTADPSTASGFAWTSPRAAGETLSSGTLASVEIKIGRQPPITLVIPLVREAFGL